MDLMDITKFKQTPEQAFLSHTRDLLTEEPQEQENSVVYPPQNMQRDFQSVGPVEHPIQSKPFIDSNTEEVSIEHLREDCIIPVFSKDNELTIAHHQFIDSVLECVSRAFSSHSIGDVEIRASHKIKGRTADAMHLPSKDLQDHHKTLYYERMMFIAKIEGISAVIGGNELSLTFGGVRSYNQENLYSKKGLERFKFFIGFQNRVCSNMCVWSDGYVGDLRASTPREIESRITESILQYQPDLHLKEMDSLGSQALTQRQFAQLIGKSKLYHFLPKVEKQALPELLFNDSHLNLVTKGYFQDEFFSRDSEGEIDLWKVYNLLTQANKSSYIDSFLDRSYNAHLFSQGLLKALNGDSNYRWFLS